MLLRNRRATRHKRPGPWEWLSRAVSIVEVVGIPVAVVALIYSIEQTQLAREAYVDQRRSTAWQIVSTAAVTSSGKQYALETLLELDGYLDRLDVSCATMQRQATEPCPYPTNLHRLTLSTNGEWRPTLGGQLFRPYVANSDFASANMIDARFEQLDLIGVNFSAAILRRARFESVRLDTVNFQLADVRDVEFSNSIVNRADLTGARLAGADFSGLTFDSELGRDWHYLNISGSVFCELQGEVVCAAGITQEFLDHSWYYKGNPPKGLDVISPTLQLMSGCSEPLVVTHGSSTLRTTDCNGRRVPVSELPPTPWRDWLK